MKQDFKIPSIVKENILPTVLIGGATYFFVIKPLLVSLGLMKTKQQQINQDASITVNAYDPKYYLSNRSRVTISIAQAESLADSIHNAFSFFYDDYSSILSVFKQCSTKADISYLAATFQNKYNLDLYAFLQDGGGVLPWTGLSTDHLTQLNTYVNNLPS